MFVYHFIRKSLSRWWEESWVLVKIVQCSCWYNCMIYGRNYLTGLQSAPRLQQFTADLSSGWGERESGKVSIFVVFDERYFPRSLLPRHHERSQQFRDISPPNMLLLPSSAFHRIIPVIATPLSSDWPSWPPWVGPSGRRSGSWPSPWWAERLLAGVRERDCEMSWCELRSDVPRPHSS